MRKKRTSQMSIYEIFAEHEIATVQSITKRNFTGTADVKIGPGFARLRPPKAMLPTFNNVEDDGWPRYSGIEHE